MILLEGGVGGHMSHLYDNPRLTFATIKKIMQAAADGELQGTEKTDGQNLFISFSVPEQKAKGARNKSNIKAGGLDVKGLAAKFKGKGQLEKTFSESLAAFEDVVKSMPKDQQVEIFGPDTNIYYSAEIIDPRSQNVISYDTKTLAIHRNGAEFDKETGVPVTVDIEDPNYPGSIIQAPKDVSKNAELLDNLLSDRQDQIKEKNYGVQMDAIKTLQALEDKTALNTALSELEKEISSEGISDNQTVINYVMAKLSNFFTEEGLQLPVELEKKVLEKILLTNPSYRYAYGYPEKLDKEWNLGTMAKGLPADQKAKLRDVIGRSKEILATAIRPIEEIIHDFSVEMIRGLESVFILDNQQELDRQINDLRKAIDAIEKTEHPVALEFLNKQMEKLKKVENISSAAEGFVFDYDGHTYKFTGNFAPMNQLMGLFKYGRKDIPAMEKIEEEEEEVNEIFGNRTKKEADISVGDLAGFSFNIERIGEYIETIEKTSGEFAKMHLEALIKVYEENIDPMISRLMIAQSQMEKGTHTLNPSVIEKVGTYKNLYIVSWDSEADLVRQLLETAHNLRNKALGAYKKYRNKAPELPAYKPKPGMHDLEKLMGQAKIREEATPAAKRTIAVYPGRFQPMGKHHLQVFKTLQAQHGDDNVYILTSDTTNKERSPLSFEEKKSIMLKHEIPEDQIIKVGNPYKIMELDPHFDADNTTAIYVVGAKDHDRLSTGKAFDKYEETKGDLAPFSEKAYLKIAPHVCITLKNGDEMCGTSIRNAMKNLDEESFEDLMGWFDKNIYDMLKKKPSNTPTSLSETIFELVEEVLNEKLKASDGAGKYVKDFYDSDAPQLDGKSKEKRREMAVAAYLQDKNEEQQNEIRTGASVYYGSSDLNKRFGAPKKIEEPKMKVSVKKQKKTTPELDREDHQMDFDFEDLDEMSAMGGGAVQGSSGKGFKRNEEETLIRESIPGIKIKTTLRTSTN